MRALVFADLHVGKGMEYAPERLGDYRHTLEQIAELADQRDVDVVLFAGDLFEGPHVPSSHYILVRQALLDPLRDRGIPLVAINGNGRHDSAQNQGEPNAVAVLGGHPGVLPAVRPMLLRPVNRSASRAGLIACLPWTPTGRLRAQSDDASDATAPELLAAIAEALHTQARTNHPDLPCVLIGHYATTGFRTPTGLPTDALGGVLFPADELERIGFDAAFFGHIHVHGQIAPGVWSVGSPLCLDFGEEHEEHGCVVYDSEAGVEFVPLDGRRFRTLDFRMPDSFLTAPDPGSLNFPMWLDGAVVRVRYSATEEQARTIDDAAIRRALTGAGAHVHQIIPTIEREDRARVAGLTSALAPAAALDAWIASQALDGLADAVRDRARAVLAEVGS